MAKRPPHVYLIAAARKIWYWGPERREAIKRAMVGPDRIQCAHCKKMMPRHLKVKKKYLFQVDHVEPVVPIGRSSPTWEKEKAANSLEWDLWLERLRFGPLQVLCIPCHKAKTKAENKERKKWKISS